ncbi:hypothetical protein [Telluribacter sp. SYSU D00476]|uniref:hypothetical protein n=1 Tax=Telluribacter sp. SYSU D00476 TaxID=2811430 RepID=UPI001FF57993|nr:hypothetical protein [Telluribacter sp. SYSU D00476]
MPNTNLSLRQFRERVQQLVPDPKARPFVCNESPLNCELFIVGFNPPAQTDSPFWSYWSDASGFNKPYFLRDNSVKQGLMQPRGLRGRIEQLTEGFPLFPCLDTPICSTPTRTARGLAPNDLRTELFRYLLDTIRPTVVYVHGKEAVEYFRTLTGVDGFDSRLRLGTIGDYQFALRGTLNSLSRMSYEEVRKVRDEIQEFFYT